MPCRAWIESASGLSGPRKLSPVPCANCGKLFERSIGVLNRAIPAMSSPCYRLRYKLSLRDLAEMFLTRGFIFNYEAVRDWEAKLMPALAENLRRRREGRVGPRLVRW